VPEVGSADDVSVTFICAGGNLARGNEAQVITVNSGQDGN
jgi:hypothetical protein